MGRALIHKKADASYTVEAAMIVPFIIFVIIALVYASFYLHDRIVVKTTFHRLINEAVDYVAYEISPEDGGIQYTNAISQSILYYIGEDKTTKERQLEAYMDTQFDKGLFITKVSFTSVDIKLSSVVITSSLYFNIPIKGVAVFFGGGGWTQSLKVKKSYFKREELTRMLTVITETGSQIKGVSEMMEKVKSIVNKIR